MTIKEAVISVVGGGEIYNIYSYDLKRVVIDILNDGRSPMRSTILRELRELRKEGYFVKCINNRTSLYRIYEI